MLEVVQDFYIICYFTNYFKFFTNADHGNSEKWVKLVGLAGTYLNNIGIYFTKYRYFTGIFIKYIYMHVKF